MTVESIADTQFDSSEAHLFAELWRVEQLVRAAVAAREVEMAPDIERMRILRARGAATLSGGVVDTLLADSLLWREDPPELQEMREQVEKLRRENAGSARAGRWWVSACGWQS
ncbi:hypothetical protein [Microbulbifer taiwanensis]|uniref:hypothetical protein n=1 Tax=Microbulbifer taiwanensis TaxID=986746 RepID=UPI00360FF5F2